MKLPGGVVALGLGQGGEGAAERQEHGESQHVHEPTPSGSSGMAA